MFTLEIVSDYSGSDSKPLPPDPEQFDIIRCALGDVSVMQHLAEEEKAGWLTSIVLWFVCVLCSFLAVPAVGWSEVFIVAFSWFQENLRFLPFLLLFS